jgi:intein/homing endonuclease
LKIYHTSGYIECTPEHYIFLPDGSYQEAGKFKVGDELVLYPSSSIEPIIKIEVTSPQETYNFEVSPQHSYIVNNVIVHNGGLNKLEVYEYTPLYNSDMIRYRTTANRFET